MIIIGIAHCFAAAILMDKAPLFPLSLVITTPIFFCLKSVTSASMEVFGYPKINWFSGW